MQNTREQVIKLRSRGLTYDQIKDKLNLSSISTVHYHLKGVVKLPVVRDVMALNVGDELPFGQDDRLFKIIRIK
jgi:DNA-binding CsgD family transcriptional regulator